MAVDASRAKSLFLNASDLADPAERAAYLERECGGETDLRARVEALLKANDDSPLPPPAAAVATIDTGASGRDSEETGQHTPNGEASAPSKEMTAEFRMKLEPGVIISNRYTLLEPIGEGGMGEVWVAKQTEPVKRKVALKLIKQGMDSRAVLSRFEQERQALAMMDHPNIAKVLDAGLTQTGQPFFVMELVNGLPLNKFCDELKLTPRERLELFVPICQAVQHAHQKGIVHRDLKPANILITIIDGKPVPKVIDFGVAKATAGRLTDESMSTQFGAIVGTLEYMSPEQAGFSGTDIDTRADIYSLGVILYELLTGLRPIDAKRLKKAALTEMIRIIQEEDPSKPSTRLSTDESLPSLAALRHTEPRKLMALLRGELDWVVMKCLEKSRERRYETANALARDVQRYLADEAVEARPASAGYRFSKFLKRNKGPVLAASLVLFALLAGIAGTTYGLIVARAQREKAIAAEKAEAEQRAKAVVERDKAIEARQQTAIERDKAIAAERKTAIERDRAIAAEAKTQTINDFLTQDLLTQAEPANNAFEDKVTLLEVLDRAAEKVGQRFVDQPELERALRVTIAGTYHGLASWDKAEAQWRALLEATRKRDPKSAETYGVQGELAHILGHRGRTDLEVLELARSAAEGLERILGPDDFGTLTALYNLATAYKHAGRLPESIALFERVRDAYLAKLGPDHLGSVTTLHNLALAYSLAGRLSESIALFERVRDAYFAKLGPDHPDTLKAISNLAQAYQAVGRNSESIAMLERVRETQIARLGPDNPDALTTLGLLATSYQATGRLPEAIALQERVRDARIAKLGLDHPDTLSTLHNLALAYQAAGRLPEAIALLERVRDARIAKLGPDHPSTLTSLYCLAMAYYAVGKIPEATAMLERVRDARIAKLGPDHPDTLSMLNNLAVVYQATGRLSEAIALQERVRDAYIATVGPDHPNTLGTLRNLAVSYWSAKQLDKSIPLFEDVLKRQESTLGRQHPATQDTAANLGINYKDAGRLDEAIPLLEEVYRASGKFPNLGWVGIPLIEAYVKAGRSAEAAKLVPELLAYARKALSSDSPQLAGALAQASLTLLQFKAYANAEPLLRECLASREKTQPDAWNTFNTKSMLGGALLGQKKFAEAESLLIVGYQGMKQREAGIPPQGKVHLTTALERLVQFYEATDKPDEAARWRKELEASKPAEKPSEKKP